MSQPGLDRGQRKARMRSNCCAMAVIRPPVRVRFVFSYVKVFYDRAISHGLLPARSTDLNPCDVYLWGTLKTKVSSITCIHLRNSYKISGTKLEPFRRNCGELLDMSTNRIIIYSVNTIHYCGSEITTSFVSPQYYI